MRDKLSNIYNFFIDFIFPPSKEALFIRSISLHSISLEKLYDDFKKAPLPPYPFIISLFAYKNPLVSEFIWSIKYKKDKHSIKLGGYALYEKLCEDFKLNENHENLGKK